jgi:hypothetical protein
MRVVHVNDIAGVSTTLVEAARADGQAWSVWRVPAGRGRLPRPLLDRSSDYLRWLRHRGRFDVWHVHYGVTGYYGWALFRGKPTVLHLHGTDVRQDLRSPWLGPVVAHAIRSADCVLYSTPDLAQSVLARRPDAVWFPAPVSGDAFSEQLPRPPAGAPRVFFGSRWDVVKGAPALIRLAAAVREARPEVELVGIDWGTHREQAAAAGVRLLPRRSPATFRRLLTDAHVVVGQLSTGILALSDLEAMALGRPLVTCFDERFVGPNGYSRRPPLLNVTEADILSGVLRALDGDVPDAADAAEWVKEHHHPGILAHRALRLYQQIGG